MVVVAIKISTNIQPNNANVSGSKVAGSFPPAELKNRYKNDRLALVLEIEWHFMFSIVYIVFSFLEPSLLDVGTPVNCLNTTVI